MHRGAAVLCAAAILATASCDDGSRKLEEEAEAYRQRAIASEEKVKELDAVTAELEKSRAELALRGAAQAKLREEIGARNKELEARDEEIERLTARAGEAVTARRQLEGELAEEQARTADLQRRLKEHQTLSLRPTMPPGLVRTPEQRAAEARSFDSFEEAIQFIARALDELEYDALLRASVGREGSEQVSLRTNAAMFIALLRVHREHGLQRLCAGTAFPKQGTTFTVGSHGGKWSHMHIQFTRIDGTWYLADVFSCR